MIPISIILAINDMLTKNDRSLWFLIKIGPYILVNRYRDITLSTNSTCVADFDVNGVGLVGAV